MTAVAIGFAAVRPDSAQGQLSMTLPDGTFSINGFGPGAGNMLMVGPTSGAPFPTVGSTLETYYQARIASLTGTNNLPIGGTGLNSTYELTVVSRFTEIVTGVTPSGPGFTATFGLAPVQVNPFFEVWFHNGLIADNLNGTGFAAGTKVLSGVIGTHSSNFTEPTTELGAMVSLENPSAPDGTALGKLTWAETGTPQGTGSGVSGLATSQVNSVILNPSFFLGNQQVTSYVLNTALVLEFMHIDPSLHFTSSPNGGGVINGLLTGSNNVFGNPTGTVAIENTSFHTIRGTGGPADVPEPGQMALLAGLAIPGVALLRRRRK